MGEAFFPFKTFQLTSSHTTANIKSKVGGERSLSHFPDLSKNQGSQDLSLQAVSWGSSSLQLLPVNRKQYTGY